MRLSIATPLAIAVEIGDVTHVRAEDATGAFGILRGHADFLTTLSVSVVTWRIDGVEHHVAVRGGVLTVEDGERVSIVTRECVSEETLAALGDAVLARMRDEEAREETSRFLGTRLELAAMRQIGRYIATAEQRLYDASTGPAAARADEFSQSSLG